MKTVMILIEKNKTDILDQAINELDVGLKIIDIKRCDIKYHCLAIIQYEQTSTLFHLGVMFQLIKKTKEDEK